MLPETDKEIRLKLRNTKLQLWGAIFLAGIFILLSGGVTALMLVPVYCISIYSASRYTASRFMSASDRKTYAKASYFGLGLIVFLSVFIMAVNPTQGYRTDKSPNYNKISMNSFSPPVADRGLNPSNVLKNNKP
jgi:heme A synthase